MVITVYAAFGGAGAGVFVIGLLLLFSDLFEKGPSEVKQDGPQPPGSPDAANERSDEDELNQEENKDEEEKQKKKLVMDPEVADAIQILDQGSTQEP